MLPREARRAAPPASGPPRRSPATGGLQAIGDGAGATVRSLEPGRRARHLPPAAPPRPVASRSDRVALKRGRVDAVTAGLLFMAGMRRSEVSALRWADVADATEGDGMRVTVRRNKTNQEGRGQRRAVRQGRRRARDPDPARRHEPGAGRRGGAALAADGRVGVHGRGAGRRHRQTYDRALHSAVCPKTDRRIIADLPDKTETTHDCHLTRKQVALYQRIVQTMRRDLEEIEGIARRGVVLRSRTRQTRWIN